MGNQDGDATIVSQIAGNLAIKGEKMLLFLPTRSEECLSKGEQAKLKKQLRYRS